jgi:ABC-2 type transport system permease protein
MATATAIRTRRATIRGGEPHSRRGTRTATALATLASRRLALSAHTPREILVPLLTPVLFAIVIAPALATIVGAHHAGIDYMTYVATGTAGLLVPISCMFAGIGVVVDRESGARRNLLAAPIPRRLIVLGNLAIAVLVSMLQLATLMVAAKLRGAQFSAGAAGIAWFAGAAILFAIAMYGIAEVLANRVKSQEEYVGAVPALAIVPWFFAGSLFPIGALPAGLTVIAKVLPLTHVLALLRYGLVDPSGAGLRDIWHMTNTTEMAALSLGVVAVYAVALTAAAVRVFSRAAVR